MEGVSNVEQAEDKGVRTKKAQAEVIFRAGRLSVIAAHTARLAVVREPDLALRWLNGDLTRAVEALREGLEDLRNQGGGE
jgi:hypothetical protein